MVAAKTKPRKVRMIPGGGPVKQERKGQVAETQAEYERRASMVLRAILRGEAEKLQQADYVKLQAGDTLISRFASATTIPFWDLPKFITDGRNAGMDVDPYVLRLHTLLATPVFMMAMSLIGAIVCLRLARSGGLSQLIGAGAMAGFVLFFATKVAAGLSNTGAAPPEAAAWCPPLFALFAVLTLLAHNEDG